MKITHTCSLFPRTHTFTHSLISRHIKNRLSNVFLSSVKAMIFFFFISTQTIDHNSFRQIFKLEFSINSVQIIYFIYTLKFIISAGFSKISDVRFSAARLCSLHTFFAVIKSAALPVFEEKKTKHFPDKCVTCRKKASIIYHFHLYRHM